MNGPPLDFSGVAGREIPGGCEQCDAFQVMTEATEGVWSLVVHHDDWCPFLRARKAEAN
jgi:hypothetical protein